MTLRISSADQRLAEANAKTTAAIFGVSGVGKTSLLKTLPPQDTFCIDLEAGMKSFRTGRVTASRCAASPTLWISPVWLAASIRRRTRRHSSAKATIAIS